MKTFAQKLEKVAQVIAGEQPRLDLFAVVPFSKLPDRWDLVISSDTLGQENPDRFRYIVARLKKELTVKEMVKISRVAFLPSDDPLIVSLLARSNGQLDLGESFPDDDFERATVLWPTKRVPSMATTA